MSGGGELVERLERLIDHRATKGLLEAGVKPSMIDPGTVRDVYANWRSRFPEIRPRRVKISRELAASAKYAEHRDAIDAIVSDIESATPLDPYLSERTLTAVEEEKPAKAGQLRNLERRRDLDLLLNDWGLHHLHLGKRKPGARFVQRGDDVICIRFTNDTAYLVDIIVHGEWSDQRLLQIMLRNWPDARLVETLGKDVRLASPSPSNEDLRQLRQGAANSAFEIDGQVCVPASIGLSTAGTNFEVTRNVVNIYWDLEPWRESTIERLEAEPGSPKQAVWTPFIYGRYGGFRAGDYFRIVTERLSFPAPDPTVVPDTFKPVR